MNKMQDENEMFHLFHNKRYPIVSMLIVLLWYAYNSLGLCDVKNISSVFILGKFNVIHLKLTFSVCDALAVLPRLHILWFIKYF